MKRAFMIIAVLLTAVATFAQQLTSVAGRFVAHLRIVVDQSIEH